MCDLARVRDIEKYIVKQEPAMQLVLREVRGQIREALPDAKETITGGKPALKYRGPLFSYCCSKRSLIINAVVEHDLELMRELDPYAEVECGRIWYWEFLLEPAVPYKLIVRMALVAAAAGKKGQTLEGRDYP